MGYIQPLCNGFLCTICLPTADATAPLQSRGSVIAQTAQKLQSPYHDGILAAELTRTAYLCPKRRCALGRTLSLGSAIHLLGASACFAYALSLLLFDPWWHGTFRKYRLWVMLPLCLTLIVIAGVYQNSHLGLFALLSIAITSSVPSFEREHRAHITTSAYQGGDYLQKQLR